VVGVGDLLGCGYYRCALPYRHLAARGFDVVLTNGITIPDGNTIVWADRELKIKDLSALVLQRQHNPTVYAIATHIKAAGGKIITEFDDYFHDLPPNNPARLAYPKGGETLAYLEKFMVLSDVISVSTENLKTNYLKFNSNIWVCPNVVERESFKRETANPLTEDGEFRLGWAGSATHHDDLVTIVKPISELMYEFPQMKFVFVGQFYKNLFPGDLHKRMENHGHTYPVENGKALFYSPDHINPVIKYYDLLNNARLHAAIAPLLQVTFNRSKSPVKILEYGVCGIPYVATNYGPYANITNNATHKPIGLLADRNPEWKRNIKRLITDESFRQSLAINNRNNILENHTIDTGINNWLQMLASVGLEPGDEEGKYEEIIVPSV
jgi:glycosyltransferase involved in cell wall biosynthesis